MKTILILLATTFTITSKAQLTKRNWLLGGSASLYSYTEKFTNPDPNINYTAKYTDIDLNTSIGYFFIDKFAAGLRPILYTYKGESNGGLTANTLQFALGPFVRYYFLDKEKQFNILSDICYQIGVNKNFSEKGKFDFFSVMAGTEVFFNSSVGLQIMLGYSQRLSTTNINSLGEFKNLKNGFQTSIGFNFHLEKD